MFLTATHVSVIHVHTCLIVPLLYLLYTAELALVVARHGLNLHQYADDMQVYVSTSASDAEAAVARLNACLVDIEAWLKASRLRLNPTKTQVMWLASPKHLAKVNVLEVPVSSIRINVSEITLESTLTVSCRYAVCRSGYYQLYGYGSSDRSSDPCQPRL